MKKPTVKICSYKELKQREYTEDEAIVIISESRDKVEEIKGKADLILLLLFLEDDKVTEAELGKLCSLEEINSVVEFATALEDYQSIYISDTGDLSRSWNIALGLNYLYTSNIRESVFLTVRERPEVEPDRIWPIMLFDQFFELDNLLIQEVDDYFASGMVIDSKGNIANGKWFKED